MDGPSIRGSEAGSSIKLQSGVSAFQAKPSNDMSPLSRAAIRAQTKKLLDFLTKKTDIVQVPLDVNDVVREVVALVQRELTSHRVSLRMELAPALPMILGDRVQLQQVIINLVINGIEAMQSVTDRPRELVIPSGQDDAHQVLVSVTDCGVRILA